LSIAAVPFQIQDSADAYLGDQIPAEILDALTRVPALTVRPLASAPRFRNAHDLGAIARELAVSTLLTGSIGHEGNAIRVTARLYDVAHNQNLPAVSFTNSVTNKFALEDSVSTSIASSFKLAQSRSATTAQLAVARLGRTAIPAAHDTLMLARFYAEQRTPLGLTSAISLFRTSIRLDSSYADAWAGLAYALSLRAVFGDSAPRLYFPAARSAVLQALRLDSTSANAHATYGLIKVFYDRDFAGAGPEFSKAMALDSTQSYAWLFRTWYYFSVNHVDSALLSVRHAWRIDPASLIAGTRVADVLVAADSLEGAERQLLSVLRVDGDFRFARASLATTYADDHQCSKALEVLPVYRWPSGAAEEAAAPYVWARCNQPERAREFIQAEEARARAGQYVNAFTVATVCAALNDRACTYSWLNRAIQNHDWALFQMRLHRSFAPYRAEPEFQELQRRVGLI
jgi:serine/threonine-protein kinase